MHSAAARACQRLALCGPVLLLAVAAAACGHQRVVAHPAAETATPARAAASATPDVAAADLALATPTRLPMPAPTATAMPTPEPTESPTPEPTEAPTPEPTPPPRPAPPARLSIPSIGVNARVIPVGEAPDGSMDSPGNPVDVGWFEPGFRPGEQGSPVIGGHVDYANWGAAVFWNLKLLRPGDQFTVTNADGQAFTYSVDEVEIYAYDDTSVIDRVFRDTSHQGLNLVTCTGTFDPRSRNYDKRIVVYSSLVSQ